MAITNRKEFEKKAIREAEKALGVPEGWWGDYRHVRGPKGVEVRFLAGGGWSLRQNGKLVSKHDSRPFAINKGKKLAGS